jgi:ribosomal protein S18 acetylase RimI-like enzyme
MRIRSAQPADAVALAALLGQMGYPASEVEVECRLESFDHPERRLLVALADDDSVVGLIAFQLVVPFERPAPQCRISTLVVDEGFRRRGAAAALLGEVEAFARERGCFRLEVTTRPNRAAARALYERFGFKETPRRLLKPLE